MIVTDLTIAEQEGVAAFQDGKPLGDRLQIQGFVERLCWANGWLYAYFLDSKDKAETKPHPAEQEVRQASLLALENLRFLEPGFDDADDADDDEGRFASVRPGRN